MVVLAALAGLGALVVVAGIVPIGASGGHWAVTRWFLSFAMARSVSTHSLGVAAPPLGDPGLVLKGAGHYELGCRPCHGSPAEPRGRTVRRMTPAPPYLPPAIPAWDVEELYYIVKHGVKFTGMPAWPSAHRDDEVWAMVAFLRRLPALDAAEYRRLVGGDGVEPVEAVASRGPWTALQEACGRCHGRDGHGRGLGAFPKLAGQRFAYLLASLRAYAAGERHSGIMEPIAAALDAEALERLARHYADLPERPVPPSAAGAAARAVGEAIAQRGVPRQRVPPCAACHGPGTTPRNPVYPDLAGQYAEYLELQLELFGRGARGGTAYGHVMETVASRLTREQRRAAALYYASLPPGIDRPAPRRRRRHGGANPAN